MNIDSIGIKKIVQNSFTGIGEKKKKFEDGKGIMMTFYTYYDLEKENALCQFWDTSGTRLPKVGSKKPLKILSNN